MQTIFTCKQDCVDACKDEYARKLGISMIMKKGNNQMHFTCICQVCHEPVVTGTKNRSKKDVDHTFILRDHGMQADHTNPQTGTVCLNRLVGGKRNSTAAELANSDILKIVANKNLGTKFKGMSIEAKRLLMVNGGYAGVTESQIKKANALLEISAKEHLESYSYIMPYMEEWKNLNSELAYDVEPKQGGTFERMTVIMPYTKTFLPNMLNVFGVDAGFMPEVQLKGNNFCFLSNLTNRIHC